MLGTPLLCMLQQQLTIRRQRLHSLGGGAEARSPVAHGERADSHRHASTSSSGGSGGWTPGSSTSRRGRRAQASGSSGSSGDPLLQQKPEWLPPAASSMDASVDGTADASLDDGGMPALAQRPVRRIPSPSPPRESRSMRSAVPRERRWPSGPARTASGTPRQQARPPHLATPFLHQRFAATHTAQQQAAPAFMTYGQQQQQVQQQALLRQQHYRQQQLRVPYWVRALASDLLQVLASREAATALAADPACLPAAVCGQLASLLPPPAVEPAEQQAEQQQRQAQQQQQQQAQEDEEQRAERAQQQVETTAAAALATEQRAAGEPAVGTAAGSAAGQPAAAGEASAAAPEEQQQQQPRDIFAAELARILSHYEGAQATQEDGRVGAGGAGAGAGAEGGAGDGGAAGGMAAGQPGAAAAAGQAAPAQAPSYTGPRHRRMDQGGFMFLLRALALMGDGVRSAMAVLLAADASPLPYATRTPAVFHSLLRLANSLQEHETAVLLAQQARQWGVPLDRQMWQLVLDVCAKAGQPETVQQLMEDMTAAGSKPDSVTHTILLMAHEKAGQWEQALEAYARMQRLGLPRNSFTYRALVSALVAADRLEPACEVLEWMADDGVAGNAVVYQILINAHLERGQQARVDQLLERMRRERVRFSHQAVSRLSGFCFSRGQPQVAYQLFKQVREMGLLKLDEPSAAAAGSDLAEGAVAAQAGLGSLTSLGSLELEAGSGSDEVGDGDGEGSAAADMERLAERQRRVERMQAASCYGRMIAACQKARLLDEAWEVYCWMLADGLSPDRATYSRLISVCAYAAGRGSDAEELYQRLLAEGVELDAFMYLHLVTAMASDNGGEARWPAVLRVLHGMQMGMPNYKDTHVQTVAVSLAAKHGRLGDALAVYRLMLQDGVQPKSPTFNALIAACMRAGSPNKGFRFFEIMQAMGVKADVVTVSTLIACCERLGDWQRAQEVWTWMEAQGLEPDTICYNTMISCLERSAQPDRALAVFEQMMEAGVAGSSATYATLCDVFAKQGKWDKLRTAVQVKEWMEAQGEDPAQMTYARLIERATEGGNWQRALELFDGMESSLTISGSQPNSHTYSAAITACARLADWQRAVDLKDQMLARGLPASPIVYNSVLAACEAARQLEAALECLEEMRLAGVPRDQYTYSTLISCCYHVQGGDLATALRLFGEMQEEGLTPNTVVINALLSVCAAVGDAEAAMQVYRHVTGTLRLQPDDITMHCMMEALGRAGRWVDGLRFFTAAHTQLGAHRSVMCLNLEQPNGAELDLHFLSVAGAGIVLRAWLLNLRRLALEGRRLPPGATFRIITGWGRNSANNVPRLKPEVEHMLTHEMGPPLALQEPPSNSGLYNVTAGDMYDWLLGKAQLGLTPQEEEEAWALLQAMAERQRNEGQQPAPTREQQQAQQAQQAQRQQPGGGAGRWGLASRLPLQRGM
ncbi:hypothetical protein C2E20_5639 [Micractinium conductrix]|uniref:Smr domain-containing protein n=1 Tax=Micractinium conductrix TaxID=554055 RepID=A0A2P6V9X2_9CHLO|nr:hypothetical protein C2E20_5639 [Micractinium conductrix]|eukprot:PSC70893.1 hypothetical protein C2E20_5639 [Micractinium conductrix]